MEDVYEFVPTTSGIHRFQVDDMLRDARVNVHVFDALNRQISNQYYPTKGNGDGHSVNLAAGEHYTIRVRQNRGLTNYSLMIGHRRPTVDVSEATIVSDRMQYNDQRNTYSYIPTVDGRHRFEIADLPSSGKIDMYIYDEMDKLITSQYTTTKQNGEGFSPNLVAGEQYTIVIRQHTGLTPYDLIIGPKKKTADISSSRVVEDSMQFRNQLNTYVFTPRTNGRHQFKISNLVSGVRVTMQLYNQGGVKIGTGTNLSKDLISNETYTIIVEQSSGFSKYHLDIDAPRSSILPFAN